jgi:hypothetical protein
VLIRIFRGENGNRRQSKDDAVTELNRTVNHVEPRQVRRRPRVLNQREAIGQFTAVAGGLTRSGFFDTLELEKSVQDSVSRSASTRSQPRLEARMMSNAIPQPNSVAPRALTNPQDRKPRPTRGRTHSTRTGLRRRPRQARFEALFCGRVTQSRNGIVAPRDGDFPVQHHRRVLSPPLTRWQIPPHRTSARWRKCTSSSWLRSMTHDCHPCSNVPHL